MVAVQNSYFFFFAAFFAFFLVAIFLFSLSTVSMDVVTVSRHIVEKFKSLKNDVKEKVRVELLAGCTR